MAQVMDDGQKDGRELVYKGEKWHENDMTRRRQDGHENREMVHYLDSSNGSLLTDLYKKEILCGV